MFINSFLYLRSFHKVGQITFFLRRRNCYRKDKLESNDNEGFSDPMSKASKQVTKVGRVFAFSDDLLKSYLICLERIKEGPAGVCLRAPSRLVSL